MRDLRFISSFTVGAVYSVAREFLGCGSGLLGDRQRGLFRANLTPGLGQDRGIAVDFVERPRHDGRR